MSKMRLYMFLWIFLLSALAPAPSAHAGACNNACSSISDECVGQKALQGSASEKMDIECLKNNSSSSCFNQVPITGGTGNYNSIGKRSSTRNHYGTDIGASNTTTAKALAAAEGEIVYARSAGGSGLTIVINHKKKCSGGGGYHTVYRHLCKMLKTGGSVAANEPIGIVGGGNTINGKVCQNPAQKSICPTDCSSGWYAIHLHFELFDGELCGSCNTQANPSKVIAPYCKDAAVLCGGCPSETACKCKRDCSGKAFGGADNNSLGEAGGGSAAVGADGGSVKASDSKSCALGEFLDSENCIFCNLFKIMFNTASDLALTANNNLATPSKNLVLIGFMIWIFFYLIKQIATFSATSTGEMLKGLLFQGFRVAVVVMILSGAIFQVMNLTLNPVMQTGLNFANSLSSYASCDASADYMQGIKGYEGNYSGENMSGGLPKSMGQAIMCSIKHLESATGVMMGLGKYSICLAHNKHRFLYNSVPGPGYMTTGWVLWAAGAFLLLSFPWCLVDCILQLCIAAAMIPCAIAAYAFKITEKYVKIVWTFFMNAMFNFVFLALIVYIINSNLADWLGLSDITQQELDIHEDIFIKGNLLPVAGGMEGLAWWGIGAIKVLAICFFCWTFFDEAGSMSKRFADSPGLGGKSGIGRMVGGTMGQMAKNYGLDPAMHYGKQGATALGRSINSAAGNKFRSGVNHYVKGKGMHALASLGFLGNEVTKDPTTGKVTGYNSKIRLFGKDLEYSVTRDENGVWTSTKTSHDRSNFDKAFEVMTDADGNPMRDENGNIQYLSRQRIFGAVNDYEVMTATKDENGFTHYTTADGSRTFTMDQNGKVVSYKTPFTRSLLNWKAHEKTNRQQFGSTKTINDGISKTVKQYDADGNLIGSKTEFKNVSAAHLLQTDGTLNANAFNQIKNGAGSAETAAVYMVSEVMKSRGIALPDTFADRKVNINDDGSFTLVQKNLVGHDAKTGKDLYDTRVINAQIIGNQMVINMESRDSSGNITRHKSNGMQTLTERYTVMRDKKGNIITDANGKPIYDYDSRMGFSQYLQQRNSGHKPLDEQGGWGNNIDRDAAMVGFTQEDFDRHLAQIQLQQLQRTMTEAAFNAALDMEDSQVAILNGLLHKNGLTQDEVMLVNAGIASVIGTELPLETVLSPDNLDEATAPRNNDGRDASSPKPQRRANEDDARNQSPQPRNDDDERQHRKNERDQRQKEAEEKAKAEEEQRQKEAEEKAKAEEEQRQKEAEEKAKAEEEQRQKEAENKAKAEKNEQLREEHRQLDKQKAQLEAQRDEITKQFAEVSAQLEAARAAKDAVGLSPEEKRNAEAAYNELYRQSELLREELKNSRKASNEAIEEYNQQVRKHNDEIPDKTLK